MFFSTKPSDFQGWSDILGLNSVFGGFLMVNPHLVLIGFAFDGRWFYPHILLV
jgi:hypothetical protein